MIFPSLQQVVDGHKNNNLRRSEFADQYLVPAASRHQQIGAQKQPRQLAPTVVHSSGRLVTRQPLPVRYQLGPSPRMLQDAPPMNLWSRNASHLQLNHPRPQPQNTAKLVLRQSPMRQTPQQQQHEMFAQLTPSQLESLAHTAEFVNEEPSLMQSMMTSASNSIQADLQKAPGQLGETSAADFGLTANQQAAFDHQMAPPLAAGDPTQYFRQSFGGAAGMNPTGGHALQSRPRLPKLLLPSINSMASKFRQHLYQTFRFSSSHYPLLSRRPPSFDATASYPIAPSYVSYPTNQFQHQHQQSQQSLMNGPPTNFMPQTFATSSGDNFAGATFNPGAQPVQDPVQHQQQQQQQVIDSTNSIASDEQEIVYESPGQQYSPAGNGTQIVQVQADSAEPGQVVEMYEQIIEQNPNSIQQIQQQQQRTTNISSSISEHEHEQAQRDESSSPDGNQTVGQDVNLITSDGTYIRQELKPQAGGGRAGIEDLRNKSNITVHHHHIIEEDQQQQQEQPAQQEAQSSQQHPEDEQQQQQDGAQAINGSVIETSQQHSYEPERIQVRQPPRVQLIQVEGRKPQPGASPIKSNRRFVNRHNSTSAASAERADYQVIRASPSSLSQRQPAIPRAPPTTTASGSDDLLADEQPSVYVKLINGTFAEPITAPSTLVDNQSSAGADIYENNSIQQQQTATGGYEQPATQLTAEPNESDQQLQAGQGELYEPADIDQRQSSPVIMSGQYSKSYNRTNRTLDYDTRPVTMTTTTATSTDSTMNDHSSTGAGALDERGRDVPRSHLLNYSQPMSSNFSGESPAAQLNNELSHQQQQQQQYGGHHYVLVDQPVVLAAANQTAAGSDQAGSGQYEPPMVFVSSKPERISSKELPFKANSNALNRKRPLKRPKSGQTTKLRTTSAAAAAAGEVDSEKATELSASHSSAQVEPARYQLATTTSSPSPSQSPSSPLSAPQTSTLKPRLRNHNLRTTSSDSTTTERPARQATKAPKSRIRWQGANGRLSSSSPPPPPSNINQTELSSSETSRREQAWIVSSMTHQAYSSQQQQQQPSNSSQGQDTSTYSSRTDPVELVAGTPNRSPQLTKQTHFNASSSPPPDVVVAHNEIQQRDSVISSKQHNSSYSSEPILSNSVAANSSPSLSLLNQTNSFVEQPTNDTSQQQPRIYANFGPIAKANSSGGRSVSAEPRGRFQTFRSSLTKSKSSRSSDWPPPPPTTTVAPPPPPSSSVASESAAQSNSNSASSHESRTAPTSFRLSGAATATSQRPAPQQQAPPLLDSPISTTPLSFLATPPNRTPSEFSARSDVGGGYGSEQEAEPTTSTVARPMDNSMAWLAASLDDTSEDRLTSNFGQPHQFDLAQQTTTTTTTTTKQTADDAGLQIKIAPVGREQDSSAAMISFSQLRHTND